MSKEISNKTVGNEYSNVWMELPPQTVESIVKPFLEKERKLIAVRFNSEKEKKEFAEFWEKHKKHIKSGNTPWISKYNAGVGIGTKVSCPECGEEKDITDTSVW